VHRLWKTALAALAIGVLGGVMAAPVGRDRSTGEVVTLGETVGLQTFDDFGLRQLFRLRGERTPPPQVAIVATNEEFISELDARSAEGVWAECIRTAQKNLAARKLPMRKEIRPWPRCMQARLIDALVARGVAVIAFDIFFAAKDDASELADDVNRRELLAAAMKRAGNVVLMHGLYRDVTCLGKERDGGCDGKEIVTERQIAPDAVFAEAALGVGQFVLPSEDENFTRFWPFKGLADAPGLSAVTLQAYADATFGSFAELIDIAGISWLTQTLALARQEAGIVGLAEAMRRLRIRLTALANAQGEASTHQVYEHLERDLGDKKYGSSGEKGEALAALLELYRGPSERYINFYGPPCTLPIYRGDRILLGTANPLVEHAACAKHAGSLGKEDPIAGKVVFVGVADLATAGIADHYTTAFTRRDGVGLSGVEIAATTFANLLTDRTLRPAGVALVLGIFIGFGGLSGGLAYALPGSRGFLAILATGLTYGIAALALFSNQDRWLPMAVPITQLAASALLFIFITSIRYINEERAKEKARRAEEEARRAEQDARRAEEEARRAEERAKRAEEEARRAEEEARRKFEAAMKALGFYVPTEMAEAMAHGENPVDLTQYVWGTVLTTDIKDFTRRSKGIAQAELTSMLNEYDDVLSGPVGRLGGVLASFAAGDRMMCAWPGLERERRARACRAALEVRAVIEAFNQSRKEKSLVMLPARIGLYASQFSIGNVGGGGRYTYSFVGDAANGAERVESLDKELIGDGTVGVATGVERVEDPNSELFKRRRILASAAVVEDLDTTFFLRRIGTFEPRGMQELPIFEIMGFRDPCLTDLAALCELYNRAIAEYEAGRWPAAVRLFEALLATWPEDEPARYFLALARRFTMKPPDGDKPWVVRLKEK
jgi:adenylate cyclase